MTAKTVAIIGAGRVGSSVGWLLRRVGYRIAGVAARSAASAGQAASFIGQGQPTTDLMQAASGADLIFITTPDRVIQQACEMIAASGALASDRLVLHMSGAHSLGLLSSALKVGAHRAVLHPLQSLASREQGIKILPGSYFRIEADPEATALAREIVRALGGIELVMPKWTSDEESAALYHAGAVAVSNYFVALVHYGLKFYQALGADQQEALKAVFPLIKGTLHNIETLGIPDALTGPIMRGDSETVRGHLAAMRTKAPELIPLYTEMARETIEVARNKGSIDQQKAEELLILIKG
jgi:predicted short-subunit dehydrogenase-like oxidoreductase (DUF2520 family)